MLKDQVAVVTGATQAIGQEVVRLLAREKVKLAIMGETEEVHRLKTELEEEGMENILSFRGIAGRENDVELLVQAAKSTFGRVDLLINNAGTGIFKEIETITTEEWMKSFEVNVQGVFLAVKAVLPIMKSQQSGTIVTVSSDAARYTFPKDATLYTSTKCAVQGLMDALTQEIREYGIRAGMVNPGLTNVKDDTIGSTYLKPEDVARACIYLAQAPDHMTIEGLNLYPLMGKDTKFDS